MAVYSFLPKLLLLVLISVSSSIVSVNGDTGLIQRTCKNTKFPDLCVASLESDATSPNADTKGLATIMVQIGVLNATATNSYLSSQASNMSSSKTTTGSANVAIITTKLLRDCAQKYAFAGKSLRDSLRDLEAEAYDYAYIDAMAAADYPNACRNAFKIYQGKVVYPADLAAREDGFKHICDVVMGIIDTLASSS